MPQGKYSKWREWGLAEELKAAKKSAQRRDSNRLHWEGMNQSGR